MNKLAKFSLTLLAAAMISQPSPAAAQGSSAPAKGGTQTPSTSTGQNAQKPAPPAGQAASPLKDLKDKASYALGMNLGGSLHRAGVDLDPNLILMGLKDALAGKQLLLTPEEGQAALVQVQNELFTKKAEANKKEGETFLAANKTKPGVVTTESGLQYKIITTGTGPKPTVSDTVVCNYRGTFIDGTPFDSSKPGEPSSFQLGRVIKGWTEALQLMPAGSKWQLFIPSDLAYGPQGYHDDIPPNKTLIFEVELVSIQGK